MAEVGGVQKASCFRVRLGVANTKVAGNRLVMASHFDKPDEVGMLLVADGLRLYCLASQERALEECFVSLL